MTTVSETIPEALQAEVDAALAWVNAREGVDFEVTGLVDAEQALAATAPRTLRLVLCGDGRCDQRSFRVTPSEAGFDVAAVDGDAFPAGATTPAPVLDPPPGARRGWLDGVLAQHAFVVLVFYRGFW